MLLLFSSSSSSSSSSLCSVCVVQVSTDAEVRSTASTLLLCVTEGPDLNVTR